ncbi:thioredoxin reductase [Micromonospora sp. WMMD980]|uniref:thioredoxin reductase n=1 Tax=Micromonospora sp. WMMD980 TaxID=3016088 RepID=UPI002417BF02|nr:thioredoxin reductase [Micromonospora sp. WMMD980]MDG4799214.1 thioredoxin reductase [Micromonospora sp. WMMD980]
MRDLRYELTAALAAADLVERTRREAVADLCAGVAERHCADLGHTPAVRSGEIGELAAGEPAASWAPASDGPGPARAMARRDPGPPSGDRAW